MTVLSRQGLPQTTSLNVKKWKVKSSGMTKATAKFKGAINVDLEWKLKLDADKFCREYMAKCIEEGMGKIGKDIKDRAYMQAGGERIYIGGMTKWQRIKAYYAATKLSPPERVRIETGLYKNNFTHKIQSTHENLKTSLTIGNQYKHAAYVESKTGNLTAAMLSLWVSILYQIGLSLGKAMTTWESSSNTQ
ncbi:hypothetical protein M0R01_03765 [bacterium]|nr:hypothetical protein [bacterium]